MMSGRNMKWAERILGLLINPDWLEELLGDLEEYHFELEEQPKWKRSLLFWYHVINCIRPSLLKPVSGHKKLNRIGMLKFNTKLALRTLRRHPALTSASIITLVLGALSFQFISSWISNELSMNKMHHHLTQLYITGVKTNPEADLTSISLQTMFHVNYEEMPEVIAAAQVHVYQKDEIKLIAKNHEFKGKAFIADSTFWEMFDFEVLAGSDQSALTNPTSVVIFESMAKRMFDEENPIGQAVELKCDQQGQYVVTTVLKDMPSNTSMDFDFIVPRHSQRFWRRIPQEIVLTKPELNIEEFNSKIKKPGRTNNDRFPESELYLIPFQDCYANAAMNTSIISKVSNKKHLNTLIFIAITIWLIALLGFNNLQSTLQIAQSKNLGIRHIIGGSKWTLSGEVFWSRFYLLLIALVISFTIYQSIFPIITQFFQMDVDRNPSLEVISIFGFLFSIILISALLGTWLVYQLKSFAALNPMARNFKTPIQQRALTTFQYIISIVLIIASLIVYKQLQYMLHKDLGIEHTNVISIDFFELSPNWKREETEKNYQYIQNSLTGNPSVSAFGQGNLPISTMTNETSWKVAAESNEYTTQNMMVADPSYLKLLGLELLQGRFFSDSLDEPNQQKVVINEAALKYWQIENINNTKLTSNTSGRKVFDFQIIGVVKDYHYEHLAQKIRPLILRYRTYKDDPFLVRFNEGSETAGISSLENLNNEINPSGTFEYEWLETRIADQYKKEQQLRKIYFSFTIIALLLSSLCLFTYAFYETHRRTKEIGIRKVMGATTMEIFTLMSKTFLKSILVAYFIALPISWYFHHIWIEQFANRAHIGWWIYAGAGILITISALIATSYQTILVAKNNPVNSLRYE